MGFALRHENLDLLVLKRLFVAVPQDTVIEFVRSAPTGAPNRRAWFHYEFLTGLMLDIPDAAEVSFTDLLDNRIHFTATPRLSRRHKVRDKLLGTPAFCPVIRKTQALVDFGARALPASASFGARWNRCDRVRVKLFCVPKSMLEKRPRWTEHTSAQ